MVVRIWRLHKIVLYTVIESYTSMTGILTLAPLQSLVEKDRKGHCSIGSYHTLERVELYNTHSGTVE